MKLKKILRLAVVLGLIVCLLCACGGNSGNTNETKKPSNNSGSKADSDTVLSFVAADKTDWDLEVAFGDINYKIAIDLNKDNTLTLKGTCTGRVQASGGNNMGGSGGQEETQAPVETQAPLTDAEKEALNFTQSGTWTYETGYGYTITIEGGEAVKTDFDKASSRQYFYTEIEKDGVKSGLTQFQAKDSSFRKEIAADYQDFEVRDAEYIFSVVVIGNNNPNSTHLYLEKDGVANSLTYSGSSPTYKRGRWNIDPEDNLLTVYIEDDMYKGDYCDAAGKEGWRLKYNDNVMYSREDVEYTAEDFEGAVTKEFKSEDGTHTLKLTEKGFAKLIDGDGNETVGKFTGEGDSMVVTMDGKTYNAANGAITISYEKSSGSGGSGETETVEVNFKLD